MEVTIPRIHFTDWGGPLGTQRRTEFYATHEKRCVACGASPRKRTWVRKGVRIELHHEHYMHPTPYEPDRVFHPLCRKHHQAIHNAHRKKGERWPYAMHLPIITRRVIRRARWWRRRLGIDLPDWSGS